MQTKLIPTWFLLLCLTLCCANAHAHGGVFLEDDLCVIQIGFYKAHFKIYQPQKKQHREFCEDIPDATESVFVMEYLHDGLREVPIDFRIIRDELNRGRFFQEEDLKKINGLDHVTEFYQAPSVQQEGILLALHQFENEGNYVGIVTAAVPDIDNPYIAVFPFRVGSQKWGYMPLIIVLALFLQLNYWLMNSGYARLRKALKLNGSEVNDKA